MIPSRIARELREEADRRANQNGSATDREYTQILVEAGVVKGLRLAADRIENRKEDD
jgi:hypothetical protein